MNANRIENRGSNKLPAATRARRKCRYPGCNNSTVNAPNMKFFAWPMNKEKSNKWAVRIGRPDSVDKPYKKINHYLICSDHFVDNHFMNNQKLKLNCMALPIPYDLEAVQEDEPSCAPPIDTTKTIDLIVEPTPSLLNTINLEVNTPPCDGHDSWLAMPYEKSKFIQEDTTSAAVNPCLSSAEQQIQSSNAENLYPSGYEPSSTDNIDSDISEEFQGEDMDDDKEELLMLSDDDDDEGDEMQTVCGTSVLQLCRTCAKCEPPMVQVFGTQGRRQQLQDKIWRVLGLKIVETDALPQQVCGGCLQALTAAEQLMGDCRKAQRILSRMLRAQTAWDSEEEASDTIGGEEEQIRPTGTMEEQKSLENNQTFQSNDKDFLTSQFLQQVSEPLTDELSHRDSPLRSVAEAARPVECHLCGREAGNLGSYLEHLSNSHDLQAVMCSECLLTFSSPQGLANHVTQLHPTPEESSAHRQRASESRRVKHLELSLETLHAEQTKSMERSTASSEQPPEPPQSLSLKRRGRPRINLPETSSLSDSEIPNTGNDEDLPPPTKRQKKRYLCQICSLQFHSRTAQIYHSQSKHGQFLRCPSCKLECTDYSAYRKHLATHNAPRRPKHQCKFCNHIAASRSQLNMHVFAQHNEKLKKCDRCGKRFTDLKALSIHWFLHFASDQNIKSHLCSVCGKTFKSESNLRNHFKIHISPEARAPIECQVCDSLIQSFQYSEHLYRHAGIKPYSCPLCPATFYSQSSLERHLKRQTHKPSFNCDLCDVKFPNSNSLRDHCINRHWTNGKYECPVCKLKFALFNLMTKHCLNSHDSEKLAVAIKLLNEKSELFKCGQCQQKFENKKSLDDHVILVHENIREKRQSGKIPLEQLLTCNMCSITCEDVPSFKVHKESHPESRTIKCRFCDKRLAHNKSRVHHETDKHYDAKPLQCSLCDGKFATEQGLLRHETKEHGEHAALVACRYCDLVFTSESALASHAITHRQDKSVFCALCDRGYRSRGSLQKHMRKQHKLKGGVGEMSHLIVDGRDIPQKFDQFLHLDG